MKIYIYISTEMLHQNIFRKIILNNDNGTQMLPTKYIPRQSQLFQLLNQLATIKLFYLVI